MKGKTVAEVVAEIVESVKSHNEYWDKHAYTCSCGGKLVEKIVGTNGFFSWTSTAYKCTLCGNEREYIPSRRFLFSELRDKGIKEVGDEYRYMFWRDWYIAWVIFGLFWVVVFFSLYRIF
ncbi:hypothetical protein L0Y46_04820 [bacterium]|nr:hypothetical protein [bacterium]